jgi:hypothetical protein
VWLLFGVIEERFGLQPCAGTQPRGFGRLFFVCINGSTVGPIICAGMRSIFGGETEMRSEVT